MTGIAISNFKKEAGLNCKVKSASVLSMRVSSVLCVALFIFFLVENPLESLVPALSLFDELLFLAAICFALLKGSRGGVKLKSAESKIIGISCGIICIGVLSNAFTGYQDSTEAVLKDILAFAKFPVGVVALMVLCRDINRAETIRACASVAKIFVTVCFVCSVLNLISPSEFFSHDFRKGIWSFKFIYTHPTFLVYSLVACFAFMSSTNKKVDIFKLMCLLVLIMTMRDKAFGFIGLVCAAWIFNISNKKKILPYLIVAAIIVLIIAWPKLMLYMSYSNSPREALYTASLALANQHFPLGGGMASIASSLSGEYYSDAYYVYGLSNVIGLTPMDPYDAGDAGFAYYLGEFGWSGMLLFVGMLAILYRHLVGGLQIGSSRRFGVFVMVGYMLIALTVETMLTNATGIMTAFILVLLADGKTQMKNGEICES